MIFLIILHLVETVLFYFALASTVASLTNMIIAFKNSKGGWSWQWPIILWTIFFLMFQMHDVVFMALNIL